MNIFKRKLHSLLVLTTTIALSVATGAALANNGNGKSNGQGSSAVLAGNGNGKSKGKGIGIVNRLDGSTIEYGTTDAEGDGSSEPDFVGVGSFGPGNGNGNGKGLGRGNNIGQGNASDGLKARIVTNQDIVYTGDALEIGFHFARGSELITGGVADAHLVIFSPPTGEGETPEPIVLPLNPLIEDPTEGEGGSEEGGSTDSSGEGSTTGDGSVTTDGSTTEDTTTTDDTSTSGEESVVAESETEEEPEVEEESGPRKLFSVPMVDDQEIPAGTYQLGLILTVPDGDPLLISDWYNGLLGLVHVRGLTISAEALPADADGDGMMDCDPELDGLTCEQSDDASTSDTTTGDTGSGDTGTGDSSTGTGDATI